MPLRSTNEPGRCDFLTPGTVEFDMFDENGKRVQCSISDYALMRLDQKMGSGEHEHLRVFSERRAAIEWLARQKFDQGRTEDGQVVIAQDDIR